jgi:dihydroorotase
MSICDYVRRTSYNPARMWGLYPRKGAIALGADADLAIVDLARDFTLSDAALHSRSKISPFNGRRGRGLPLHTLVRGRFVMKDRKLLNGTQGWGHSVHRIQHMPAPQVRNADSTMQAITRKDTAETARGTEQSHPAAGMAHRP